ncbi:MAG: phosphoribosylformimino-5-aminoimidazole carboxamide ribotide isomerase [Acidimicrobiaceae bacterium]
MDLYPSIDLRAGRVVRLHQGQFDQETIYGDDPVSVAKSFEAAGAPWIHVVDLDAARRAGSNRELVTAVAASVSVPVQTGGGVRDGSLLGEGLSRVVVGSAAIEDPGLVPRLAVEHAGGIAVGLDHWDGEVRTRGWEQQSGRQLLDVATELAVPGVAALVVTDISRDATLAGPDTDWLSRLSQLIDVALVASGGVGSLDDLRRLRDLGVSGAIVGKAIYERRFTVEEAVAACAA